ncbi:MAG TPA: hypothetical protein VMU57_01615 [Edaphobacter sp.]|uniref:hypothetical protein n=1 Tax=Edaphobacter sp. TaxID=1934404 RepID=UPI002BCDA44F|nr:hypothetical protein [Edaphobacter sp.]HUZ93590.1 hypothetical protein [Edaphobacter sp.]
MKCFYHTDQDAAGMCSQCGKAACHDCLKEVGSSIVCKGCIAQHLREVETEKHEVQADREAAIAKAKKRIKTSKIVFTVLFVCGIVETVVMLVGSAGKPGFGASELVEMLVGGLIAALILGYYAWSFYWGIPAVWTGLRKALSKTGCFVILNPITWLIMLGVFLMVLMIFGEFYCIFGGGWSQYRKRVRLIHSES